MGASIYWQPIKGVYLNVYLRSDFLRALEDAFGGFPATLTDTNIPTLQGMYATTREPAYQELIAALEKHKQIRVWAEW